MCHASNVMGGMRGRRESCEGDEGHARETRVISTVLHSFYTNKGINTRVTNGALPFLTLQAAFPRNLLSLSRFAYIPNAHQCLPLCCRTKKTHKFFSPPNRSKRTMSRYPPPNRSPSYPMQNVTVQFNPNANPFEDDPQNAPLLTPGYNNISNPSSRNSNRSNTSNDSSHPARTHNGGHSPAHGLAPVYRPMSPYTPYQQPSLHMPTPMPMPSPIVHNPFNSSPQSQSLVRFNVSTTPSPIVGGPMPPISSPAAQPDTRHYGPVPIAQRRRFHTTRKVKLTSGNLVLDCPVPSKFLKTLVMVPLVPIIG